MKKYSIKSNITVLRIHAHHTHNDISTEDWEGQLWLLSIKRR